MALNVGIKHREARLGRQFLTAIFILYREEVGDVADPIGGVRNVIPGKGNYKGPFRGWLE